MQNKENTPSEENTEGFTNPEIADNTTEKTENTDETTILNKTKELEEKVVEINDKYLRLYSEFDNYRKRSLKEKSDFIKTAAEDVFKSILPVIDDLDRAIKSNEDIEDSKIIKEGIQLIYNKLKNNTLQKGLVSFDSIGLAFDADKMEAITHIPATSDEQKGIVIDETEKGYKLGDKVIRFAKVIVAQ